MQDDKKEFENFMTMHLQGNILAQNQDQKVREQKVI
jgi:hypothetical protein